MIAILCERRHHGKARIYRPIRVPFISLYNVRLGEDNTARDCVCVCVAGGGLVVKREGGEGYGVCGGVREETGGVGESHSRPLSHQVTLT